jgi:hypothetical protein
LLLAEGEAYLSTEQTLNRFIIQTAQQWTIHANDCRFTGASVSAPITAAASITFQLE